MKRTLALVLALVMAIGLMAFPVSADFTDDTEIKYAEAVDVMSAIGVINGFEDGSFDPDGYLTREQAAKVVAYLMLGAKDADALGAVSAPFDDVAANRWSAGYIAYCVNEGIINGRSETTFDPTGNVTGYEFAKLMLGCLGYSVSIEKYTGAQWNINVAKTALTIGLFDGNKGANYNVALTREEAALYAFNMLQADLVDYDNRGTVIELPGGGAISTGASKAEPVTTTSKSDTIKDDETDAGIYTVQFAERYFEDLVKNAGEPDDFQRPSTKWVYDKDTVGTYSDEPEYTYTVATKGSSIYSDLGKPSDADFSYVVDGKDYTEDTIKNLYTDFVITSGTTGEKKIGGNGTLIEVYDVTADGATTDTYRVVVINTYVGTITSWNEADEDKDEEESVDIATMTVDPTDVTGGAKIDYNFETTKFTEDDADDETVVLYTAAWDEDDATYYIKSVDAAESVTAAVTKTTGDSSFVAGGETYKYSAQKDGTIKYDEDADDAIIYLDNYGYAIYVDFEGNDSDDYAYVLDIAKDSGDIWDTEGTMYAKMILASGEIVIAEIDNEGEETNLEKAFETHVVTYDVDKDGVYTLTDANSKGATGGNINFKVTAGSSKITATSGAGSETFYANAKTIFIVAEYDDDEATKYDKWDVSVYTGIANVPSIDGAYRYRAHLDGNVADIVFIEAPDNAASSEDYVFVAYDADAKKDVISSSDGDYITVNAVVNGEITTLNIEYNSDAYKDYTKNIICEKISYTSDDFVKALTGTVDYTYTGASAKIEDGVIKVGNAYYSVGDDCDVFIVEDGDITAGAQSSVKNTDDQSDSVTVICDEDDIVSAIFIKR